MTGVCDRAHSRCQGRRDCRAGSVERWGSGHARDSRDTAGLGTLCDITLTVETCELDEMKTAYDRILLNDVRFRAVLE